MEIIKPEFERRLLNPENEYIKKDIMNEISKFGLSQNQSKTFLFLSKSGPKTASQISKLLSLPRTETYHILSQLQSRGIVIADFGKPTKFETVAIEKAIEILVENERTRIDELVSSTEEIVGLWNMLPENVPGERMLIGNRFQVLQGKNSILGKIKQLIQTSKKEILIFGSENDFGKFYHTDLFEIIKNTKVELKILASFSKKSEYIFEHLDSKQIKRFNEIKGSDLFFIIIDNQETIFFMKSSQDDKDIMALWTESKTLINSLKLSFNLVWLKSNYLNASDDLKTETEDSLDHLIKELEQEKRIVESLKKHVSKTKTSPKR